MSGIPKGWEQAPLGQVAATQLGRMLSSRRETGSNPKPYLRNRDVQWGRINTSDLPVMDFDPKDAGKFLLRPGDVLVCEGGEVGRSAIWNGQIAECYYQKALHRVRTSPRLLPVFLVYMFEHYARARKFEQHISGSTIAHLPQEDLRELTVPLPPVFEQKQIVEAIEKQFSCLDVGIAALQSAQKRIGSARKAILLAAVPEIWPELWRKVTVAEAGQVTLGRQRAPQFHTGPKMRPYLRVANVFEDRIDSGDIMSMHFDDEEFERFRLRPEDILLNEGQSPHLLGRPAMYRGDPPEVAFTNSLIRFRAGPDVLPAWALLVFRRHMHAKRFMNESQITTNIAHLSAGRFKNVEFPIPPMDEQKLIVATVEEKLSEVSRMEAMVDGQLARAERLRSSILAAAFSGRLVSRGEAAV